MQVVVTGSLAFDQIMIFPEAFVDHIMPDKIHSISVSFLVDHLHKNYGGVAGNISYNLGLLGKKPICFATAGRDAEDYKVFLEKNGVNVDHLKIELDDYTGSFVVITDKSDSQIAGFYPGAMRQDVMLKLMQIVDTPDEFNDMFLVVAPTMPLAMNRFVEDARDHGVRYLYSPAQQIPRLSKENLIAGVEGAEIVIGNDYEVALIEEKTGMSRYDILRHVKILITTLGKEGSRIETSDGQEIRIGTARTDTILDPTGEGDAYIAGFLSGCLEGTDLERCGQLAATTSVFALEQYGTTGHTFSREIFDNRLKENFG